MSKFDCEIFCINGREFEVPNDYFRSLHALRIECNSYTQAETRYKEVLAERDRELLDKVAEKLKVEMIEDYPPNINGVKVPTPFTHFSYCEICKILDKVIAELKARWNNES